MLKYGGGEEEAVGKWNTHVSYDKEEQSCTSLCMFFFVCVCECVYTWISLSCLLCWDTSEAVMFEIPSLLRGTLSLSWSVFIQRGLSERRGFILALLLCDPPSCLLLLTNTHTCSASWPNPLHTPTRASRPHIRASRCCHGNCFDPVSTSEVCLGRGNLPPPHPSLSSFRRRREKKKAHPPSSGGVTIPSPILSLRFIHPQCLAPAISSPPTLTPTPCSLFKSVCIHTHLLLPCTDWEIFFSEGGVCIWCWFQAHSVSYMQIADMSPNFLWEHGELVWCIDWAKPQREAIVLNIYTGRSPETSYLCAEFDLYVSAAGMLIIWAWSQQLWLEQKPISNNAWEVAVAKILLFYR